MLRKQQKIKLEIAIDNGVKQSQRLCMAYQAQHLLRDAKTLGSSANGYTTLEVVPI